MLAAQKAGADKLSSLVSLLCVCGWRPHQILPHTIIKDLFFSIYRTCLYGKMLSNRYLLISDGNKLLNSPSSLYSMYRAFLYRRRPVESQCSHVQSFFNLLCSSRRFMFNLLYTWDWVNYHQENFHRVILHLNMPMIPTPATEPCGTEPSFLPFTTSLQACGLGNLEPSPQDRKVQSHRLVTTQISAWK